MGIRLRVLFLTGLLLSFASGAFSQYTYHCGGSLIHFHGTSGYLDAEDPYVNPTGVTLAAWVRCEVRNPSNMGLIYRQFFVIQGAQTTVQYGLIINNNHEFAFVGMIDTTAGKNNPNIAEFSTAGQLDSLSSGVVPDSGTFYHIAVTLDPVSFACKFYVNGVVVASKGMKGALHWANDGASNRYDASIGAESLYYQGTMYPHNYFNGYMDDVVETGSILTKTQIDSIAEGKQLTYPPYMYYKSSEGSGAYTESEPGVLFNAVNYGNTGYLSGDYA